MSYTERNPDIEIRRCVNGWIVFLNPPIVDYPVHPSIFVFNKALSLSKFINSTCNSREKRDYVTSKQNAKKDSKTR